MWTTTSTSRQRFSSQSNMSSGGTKSPIGCLAMLRHLPRSVAQPVADHHVQAAVLGQPGDDVGADEAGPAGHQVHPSGAARGRSASGGAATELLDEARAASTRSRTV